MKEYKKVKEVVRWTVSVRQTRTQLSRKPLLRTWPRIETRNTNVWGEFSAERERASARTHVRSKVRSLRMQKQAEKEGVE